MGVDVDVVTVIVELPEPVTEVGLKLELAPDGRPDAPKVTMPLKPFCGVTVIVLVPLAPRVTVRLLGDAERLKFDWAAAFTVRLTVVVCVKLPDVPVTVTVAAPVVAVPFAVSVKMLEEVAGFVPNVAVTPFGTPVADKVTLPEKPFDGVMAMVLVPALPP